MKETECAAEQVSEREKVKSAIIKAMADLSNFIFITPKPSFCAPALRTGCNSLYYTQPSHESPEKSDENLPPSPMEKSVENQKKE